MKWFYTLKNHVKGPFSTEEFETALMSLGSDIKNTYVWTRGKEDWSEAERWSPTDADKINAHAQAAAVMNLVKQNVPNKPDGAIPSARTDHSGAQSSAPAAPLGQKPQPQNQKPAINAAPVVNQTPAAQAKSKQKTEQKTQINPQTENANIPDIIMPTDDEITKLLGVTTTEIVESIKDKSEEKFRVQFNGVDQPPMNKADLIKFTAQQEDPSLIMVFDKKSNDWKEIYSFPDIIEKLGLSRRQNRRVTVLANFKGSINNGPEINARLTTISLGGFGLTDVFDLKIGDVIKGQISSPHFYTPISVQGEVTYAGSHGSIGLKFVTISDEAQALVVDYIKKFGQGIKTEEV